MSDIAIRCEGLRKQYRQRLLGQKDFNFSAIAQAGARQIEASLGPLQAIRLICPRNGKKKLGH